MTPMRGGVRLLPAAALIVVIAMTAIVAVAAARSPVAATPPAPVATTAAGLPSVVVAVAGRANAHVSLAAAGRFVTVVWSGTLPDGVTDVFAAVSRDGGASFGPPVRVNQNPGEARVNGEQPPRVALVARPSGEPAVVVIWTSKASTGTRLLTARSEDGGRTFGRSTLVPGTDAPGNRGWQAIGADSSGRIHAVWLDHRRMVAPDATRTAATHRHGEGGATTTPGGTPDGVAMAQQSDLYFDTLSDATAPRAITPGVCYCCKTALAFGTPGRVFVAWRHVYPGNFRDMAFAASSDGGRTFTSPVRVSQDNWMLTGCPDDGPAMTVDAMGRIHMVWPAVVEGRSPTKALFYATSADGRTFQPRVRIPTEGQANHPQLALAGDGTLVLAWDESGSGTRTIVTGTGRVEPSGRVTFVRAPLGHETGVYPAVAAVAGGAVVAWTAGPPGTSAIRLRRLP